MVSRISPIEIITAERMINISDKIAYCADKYIVLWSNEIDFNSKITILEP